MAGFRVLWVGAWLGAAGAVVAAAVLWTSAAPEPVRIDPPRATPVEIPGPPDAGTLRIAASVLRDRNPFRLARSPTRLRFGEEASTPEPDPPPEPEAAPDSAPDLTLGGLIRGAPGGAVIEGVPGWERGLLLFIGEERAGVRLMEIRGDTAVLNGDGATWTLTPRSSWRR